MNVGIESISLYVPRYYLALQALAKARQVPSAKFPYGLGQERMAVTAPDEDVVTMGANAAFQALQGIDPHSIDSVIFATESGIDQSKAAAIYVHKLLGLPSRCRTFEVKQACCSSTAALQMSLATAALRPDKRTLIIASDVARYGFNTPGEATQGAGAIAMVVSARPEVVVIDPAYGSYTNDVMDFWRPNYMDEALVDGKYSIRIYKTALEESWKHYETESPRRFGDFARFCYHLPFTRMAEKAHFHLAKVAHGHEDKEVLLAQLEDSLKYNRIMGNCYTASLYMSLLSLLDNSEEDLTGKAIGLFSYGSGCMGTFFGATVSEGYRRRLPTALHRKLLHQRTPLSFERYEAFYRHQLPQDGSDYQTPRHNTGRYRLAGIRDHKRLYEVVQQAAAGASPAKTVPAVEPHLAST